MNTNKRIALWESYNLTPKSSVFCVAPGQAVILTGVGFADVATKESADEFTVEQVACVERVLFEFSANATKFLTQRCDWVLDLNRQMAEEISAETVTMNNCEWTLSQCRNVAVIGLPGTYRLVLNDNSERTAQVYAEVVGVDQVKPDSLFFGGE